MDDAEWFASADAVAMLRSLFPLPGPHSTHDNTRLVRLYLAACCRRQWPFLPWACRRMVELAELHADNAVPAPLIEPLAPLAVSLPGYAEPPVDWNELTGAVRWQVGDSRDDPPKPFRSAEHWEQTARLIAFLYYRELPPFQQVRAAYHHADFVRDLFSPTLRSVPFGPRWRSDAAVALAETMYATNTFDRMSILADALEEAGCDESTVLHRCRDDAVPHVRGCWVVDLLLGKN